MKQGELHLMIIWERARYKQEEIIADISSKFQILEKIEILWASDKVSSNFTRFYGVKLPDKSVKEKECGKGAFLLLLLWDSNPIYQERKTSHGIELTNTKMFDSKMLYRSWTGGGHKIHGTTSVQETNHDLTLLIGKNYEDYVNNIDFSQCKESHMQRDLEGCYGWDSLQQFFYVLNNTINYVILRGEEEFDAPNANVEHGDIDFLVDGYQNFIYLSNSNQTWDFPMRPRSEIVINGNKYILDLWESSLPYHSISWHETMLRNRIKDGDYYKLDSDNKFYSTIYHCLYNKCKIANDYDRYLRQELQGRNIVGLCEGFDNQDFDIKLYYILINFMKTNGYEFTTVSQDKHYFSNERIADLAEGLNNIKAVKEFENIHPTNILDYTSSGYLYYTAIRHHKKVFIKYGGIGESAKNEYEMGIRLYNNCSDHFLRPELLFDNSNKPILLFDYIEGTPLEQYITKDKTENISKQLNEIIKELTAAGVMHRDIRPSNFIVIDDNIVLIDFQYAIDINNPQELSFVTQNYKMACDMGDKFRSSKIGWNDVDSYILMCNALGVNVHEIDGGKTYYMPAKFILKYYYQYIRLRSHRLLNKILKS